MHCHTAALLIVALSVEIEPAEHYKRTHLVGGRRGDSPTPQKTQHNSNCGMTSVPLQFRDGYICETKLLPKDKDEENIELYDHDVLVGSKRSFGQMLLGINSKDQEPVYKARKTEVATVEEVRALVKSLNDQVSVLNAKVTEQSKQIAEQSKRVTSLEKRLLKEKLQRKLETEILNISLDFVSTTPISQIVKQSNAQQTNSFGRLEDIIENIKKKRRLIPNLEQEWLRGIIKALEVSTREEWSNIDDLIEKWKAAGENNLIPRGICHAFSLENEESIKSLFE